MGRIERWSLTSVPTRSSIVREAGVPTVEPEPVSLIAWKREEFFALREQGLTDGHIREVLGMKLATFERMRDRWLRQAAAKPCATCNAEGTEPCLTPSGRAHNGRYAASYGRTAS